MKKMIAAAAVLVLLAGCSSHKEFVKSQANVTPCSNEVKTKISDFYGESVDKLNAFQSGSALMVSFELKTMCNSNIDYDVQVTGQTVKLKIKNLEAQKAECVCTKNFAVELKDLLEPGTYTVVVTNDTGYQMLAQKTGVVIAEQ